MFSTLDIPVFFRQYPFPMDYPSRNESMLLKARDGQSKMLCPWCSGERKDRFSKCLSVCRNHDAILYNCWHCGVNGMIRTDIQPGREARLSEGAGEMRVDEFISSGSPVDSATPPIPPYSPLHGAPAATAGATTQPAIQFLRFEYKPLSENGLAFLSSRGISSSTAESLGILSVLAARFNKLDGTAEGVAFPYEGGFKVRSIMGKAFTADGQQSGVFPAHPEPSGDFIIICEGELDAASLWEAGFRNAWSLPHGAIQHVGSPSDSKLKCLRDLQPMLDGCKKIIIATDNDAPGLATASELARRLGRHRCWLVKWPDGCKDANDVLVKMGADVLREAINSVTPWEIEGLYGVPCFASKVDELYLKGLGKGLSTGYACLDELYSINAGHLTVVTGVPGHGKSEFVDQLMVNLASAEDWKFAVCSFENPPALHIAKLMAKREGKPFFHGPTKRMDKWEMERSRDWVNEHFSFLHSESGDMATMDGIIERLKIAVLRHGIRGAVIDPYNYIIRPRDISETQWISDMLSKICSFTRAHDIHLWFVAHPTKMQRGEDGKIPVAKGYDVSSSAAWFSKADFGITVHRPDPIHSYQADVHVWKVRFGWTGANGECSLMYNPATYSYTELPPPERAAGGAKYSSFDL